MGVAINFWRILIDGGASTALKKIKKCDGNNSHVRQERFNSHDPRMYYLQEDSLHGEKTIGDILLEQLSSSSELY
jgi:hypothetical protein